MIRKNIVRQRLPLILGDRLLQWRDCRPGSRSDHVRSRSMRLCGLLIALRAVVNVLADVARFGCLTVRAHTQLAAENLFLRKQLALSGASGEATAC